MKLILHGGFFSEYHTDEETKNKKQEALKNIIKKGFEYLKSHTSIQTVVYVVTLLENNSLFNAGTGSQIQADGKIRMSAALMDGANLKMSGVINIQKVKNPILVAEVLMNENDRVLGGTGAKKFARHHGFTYFNPMTSERKKEYVEKISTLPLTSTVGCVCIDSLGNIAVATSTGGKGFEIPGRVSDSATVAGNYANAYCGVSLTGIGEDIVSNGMAVKIVTRVTDGMSLENAFEKTFKELNEIKGFAGAIAIDYKGNVYHRDSHPTMIFASYDGVTLNLF